MCAGEEMEVDGSTNIWPGDTSRYIGLISRIFTRILLRWDPGALTGKWLVSYKLQTINWKPISKFKTSKAEKDFLRRRLWGTACFVMPWTPSFRSEFKTQILHDILSWIDVSIEGRFGIFHVESLSGWAPAHICHPATPPKMVTISYLWR